MDTKEIWAGEFGGDYLKRNRVDWRARIPFWKMILDKTGARSVFEFGCNAGWNMSAIRRIHPDVILQGLEINNKSRWEAESAGLDICHHMDRSTLSGEEWLMFSDGIDHGITFAKKAELVFTAGVLIHVPPDDLKETMQKLIDNSTGYVLAVEYYAEEETEIEYRGEKGLLWKRNYGGLYQDMGLELIDMGTDDTEDCFDNSSWWLLRR